MPQSRAVRLIPWFALVACAAPPKEVAVAPAPAQENIQLAAVRQIMTANQELFEACYIAQAAVEGSNGGIVRLRLVIDEEGNVSHARIAESNLNMAQAETCMLDVAGELQFDRPVNDRSYVLHFSFMFFAAGEPQEQTPLVPSPRHSRPRRRMREGVAYVAPGKMFEVRVD